MRGRSPPYIRERKHGRQDEYLNVEREKEVGRGGERSHDDLRESRASMRQGSVALASVKPTVGVSNK